ncbi:MAG: winged helix-turn-helix domain-containing protein [Anaerolineae bacterium]|nr:winged helix-turn-helix domain-containing protein [Anaerolineae bacterium]
MLNINAIEPVYLQLYNKLRDEIENGKIQQGEMMPSERRLAVEFGISRMTARVALRRLHDQGYIVIEPKIGALVL